MPPASAEATCLRRGRRDPGRVLSWRKGQIDGTGRSHGRAVDALCRRSGARAARWAGRGPRGGSGGDARRPRGAPRRRPRPRRAATRAGPKASVQHEPQRTIKAGGPSTGQLHGLRWLRHPKARRGRCPQALRGDRTAAAPGTRGGGICGSLVPPRPDGLAGSRGSRASRHCRVGQASAARLPARRSLPRVGGGDLVRPRCHRPHREGRAQERPGSVGHAAPRVPTAANEALA